MRERAWIVCALAAGLSSPARPCSEELVRLDPVPLLTDGATVPTNVIVVAFPAFAPTAFVTPAGGVEEQRTVDDDGRIFLEPGSAYTVRVGDISADVVTGPGPDTTPPSAPTILDTRVERSEGRWTFGICEPPPFVQHDPGVDFLVADFDLGADGVAAASVTDDGRLGSVARDGAVRLGTGGVGRVVVLDAAGNRSEVVEVDVDAALAEANGGGCAQAATTTTTGTATMPLVVLGAALARRRRRTSLAP